MGPVFRENGLDGDIESLVSKYPSLEDDVRYVEALLREGPVPSKRCQEFVPEWVWRVNVHISAFAGHEAADRCTLVYERYGPDCHLWLLFDNDNHVYENMIGTVKERRRA